MSIFREMPHGKTYTHYIINYSTCANGKFECVEEDCECPADNIRCETSSGYICITPEMMCDDVIDCPSGIDEVGCSMYYLH